MPTQERLQYSRQPVNTELFPFLAFFPPPVLLTIMEKKGTRSDPPKTTPGAQFFQGIQTAEQNMTHVYLT